LKEGMVFSKIARMIIILCVFVKFWILFVQSIGITAQNSTDEVGWTGISVCGLVIYARSTGVFLRISLVSLEFFVLVRNIQSHSNPCLVLVLLVVGVEPTKD
jgi:hypothetical protein